MSYITSVCKTSCDIDTFHLVAPAPAWFCVVMNSNARSYTRKFGEKFLEAWIAAADAGSYSVHNAVIFEKYFVCDNCFEIIVQVPLPEPIAGVQQDPTQTDYELFMNLFGDKPPSISGLGDLWCDVQFLLIVFLCGVKINSKTFALTTG